MDSAEDKHWASKYLLDPLNAPVPSEETGPGSHYTSTFSPKPTSRPSESAASAQKQKPSVSVRQSNPALQQNTSPTVSTRSSNNPYRNASNIYPSPPKSASPRSERFPDFDGSYSPTRQSIDQVSTQIPTSTGGQTSNAGGRRRNSSLTQRFPGDQSHRPLHMLQKDANAAYRAPHLKKKHQVGADSVDRLDGGLGAYHHEGPFDATLLARNTSYANSPVEAVSDTNEEALKATPRELIQDSIVKHRPLDGVAMVPSGTEDRYGNSYHYQEGTDMMIEKSPDGGAYKRWPGVTYHPEDLKGKGEPSYSLEKALKDHKSHNRNVSEGNNAIEMTRFGSQRRPLSTDSPARPLSDGQKYAEWEGQVRRSSSGAGKLKKRFGSLRGKKST